MSLMFSFASCAPVTVSAPGGRVDRIVRTIVVGSTPGAARTNALETAVTLRPAVDFSALEYVLVYKTDQGQGGSTG